MGSGEMSNYTLAEIMEKAYKEFGISNYQKKSFEELKAEKFADVDRVQDWRNYISGIGNSRWNDNKKAAEAWRKLSDMERLFQYVRAVEKAEAEEWD